MEQRIHFCTASDGVRIAYARHGRGVPIVKVANWITHVEFDWQSPLWRHWWEELGRTHEVVRYDIRGCGLSDRNPETLSFDVFVEDLETVIDSAGLEKFSLLGISQGGATAIDYAVRHPERVTHLILYGAYARGRMRRDLTAEQEEESELLQSIVRIGWGQSNPEFRRVFTTRFVPGATAKEIEWFEEMMRISTSPQMAVRLRAVWGEIDVTRLLGHVAVPTLVAHSRGDIACPFEEGRLLAARIPDARLLPLDSRNHALLADEPAWARLMAELHDFLGTEMAKPVVATEDLSPREIEVVRLVATGMSNEEIAERLFLSPRTVERHLSNIYAKLGVSGKAARAAAASYLSRIERSGTTPG